MAHGYTRRNRLGWAGSAHPGAADKYFIVSVDAHVGPPPTLFRERIEKQYIDRLSHVKVIDGRRHLVIEGRRPMMLIDDPLHGEDLLRGKAGNFTSLNLLSGGADKPERLRHQGADGIDAEVIFPNGPGLMIWSTPDPDSRRRSVGSGTTGPGRSVPRTAFGASH